MMPHVALQVFGQRWDAPMLDEDEHLTVIDVPTPVGVPCLLCDHPIVDGEQGIMRPYVTTAGPAPEMVPLHRGCEMATTVGHVFGLCSCTGYDTYEAGQELARRADAGTLRIAGS